MLVVFDNHIGQLLPGEVLLGPLLIILILRPVQGLPELVGMPDTGTSCGAGSEMWSLELERPHVDLELSPLDPSSSCQTYYCVGQGILFHRALYHRMGQG